MDSAVSGLKSALSRHENISHRSTGRVAVQKPEDASSNLGQGEQFFVVLCIVGKNTFPRTHIFAFLVTVAPKVILADF